MSTPVRTALVIAVALAVVTHAAETVVRLKSGKVFRGEVVAEAANFITLRSGNREIKILRSIIESVGADGAAAEPAAATPSPPPPAPPPPTAAPEPSPTPPPVPAATETLSVKLKNGGTLRGTMLADKGNFLALQVNGRPVNVLKAIIESINGEPFEFSWGKSRKVEVEAEAKVEAEVEVEEKQKPAAEAKVEVEEKQKREARAEVKPEAKVEVEEKRKPEAKAEVKPEAKVEEKQKPKAKAEVKAEAKVEEKQKPKAKAEVKAEAKVEEKRKPAVEAEAKEGQKPAAKAKPVVKTEPAPEPQPTVDVAQLPSLVRPLVAMLNENDALKQVAAALKLRELGPQAAPAVPYLIRRFRNTKEVRRSRKDADNERMSPARAAGLALVAIGEAAVPNLVRALHHNEATTRLGAVKALGDIKVNAGVDPLIAMLRDRDDPVRASACEALGKQRDPRTIPLLITAMNEDESPAVQSAAESSLRSLTEIPLLIEGLRDQSRMVRENATYILWLMTTKEFRDDADAWERWWKEEGSKGEKTEE